MMQVASCEQVLIKTNRKPIQNQSKTMLLFKTYTLEYEFDRHLEHVVSYQGTGNGLPMFLLNLALLRFLSLIFHISPTIIIKNRSYLDIM